jgi:pimeloyl-ACP methyl ester carboxylesterase
MDTLTMRTGGEGEPAILFLHGLGATGAVWAHLTDQVPRRVLVPDLPGHGPSAPLPHYSFETLTTAVARALPGKGPLVVAGHSLGGVLALELASGKYDVDVVGVLALGVKVEWSQDDLGRAASFAARPPRVFGTQAEADQAYLKVSGLLGIAPADPAGLRETEGGWRLAMDPAAFGVGAPDMPALLAAARCPVVLAAGEHDPMRRPEQLRALDPDAVTLAGLGHNAHVEDPAAIRALLERFGV